MKARELAVGVGEVEGDRLFGYRPAAADFGAPILESLGKFDANAMFLPRDGIDDRFADRLNVTGHDQLGPALVHIDLEIDIGKHRRMDRLGHACEDLEERSGRGILAG